MSLFGDIAGAAASFAMGNPIGGIENLAKGIEDLLKSSSSPQQLKSGLSQMDQQLQLPTGTLEDILKAQTKGNHHQQLNALGLGGGHNPMSESGRSGGPTLSPENSQELKMAVELAVARTQASNQA